VSCIQTMHTNQFHYTSTLGCDQETPRMSSAQKVNMSKRRHAHTEGEQDIEEHLSHDMFINTLCVNAKYWSCNCMLF
jgi:hypothetical protein